MILLFVSSIQLLCTKPPVYIYYIYTLCDWFKVREWLDRKSAGLLVSLREVSEALNEFLFVFQHVSAETVCIETVCRRTEPCSRDSSLWDTVSLKTDVVLVLWPLRAVWAPRQSLCGSSIRAVLSLVQCCHTREICNKESIWINAISYRFHDRIQVYSLCVEL